MTGSRLRRVPCHGKAMRRKYSRQCGPGSGVDGGCRRAVQVAQWSPLVIVRAALTSWRSRAGPFPGARPMSATQYDVLGIGNAIVDVIARTDDDFLAKHGMNKGGMMLIDEP